MRKSTKIINMQYYAINYMIKYTIFYEYYLRFHLFDNQFTINCKFQMYFHGGVCM